MTAALRAARAIVVGAGAVGGPAAGQLVASGVGHVGVVDGGEVCEEDVGGGLLQFAPDVGTRVAESTAAKLGLLALDVLVEPYPVPIDVHNAEAIVAGAGVVVECSGSPEARLAVNAACCAQTIPLVTAAATGEDAVILAVSPSRSACCLCAFGDDQPTSGGATRPLAGAAGSLAALAALAFLAAEGGPPLDCVLRLDARLIVTPDPVARRRDCAACGEVGRSGTI